GLGGVFCAPPEITPPSIGSSPKRRSCGANRSMAAFENPPKRKGSSKLERELVSRTSGRGETMVAASSFTITRPRSGDPPETLAMRKLSLGDQCAVEAPEEG